ncbi:efflux RND transporter periplasmic adaptor subunit [Gracilimonas sp. Q87]|uniref:efflux RND transporter periplasmic adaptor subunit n=1 Tax=Gracilimonas sp. Q87 TaxID=3384766 RepID=UPI003983EA20
MKFFKVILLLPALMISCNSGEQEETAVTPEQTAQKTEASNIKFITVNLEDRPQFVTLNGRLKADNRLMIFPEIQGKILPPDKPFREGITYERGETILKFDSEELRLQIQASKSRFITLVATVLPDVKMDFPEFFPKIDSWYSSIHPQKKLPALPHIEEPQLQQFLSSRGVFDTYYQIRSAESKLQKFTIKAPFSGALSKANAEPGQTVGPQFNLGTLVDPTSFTLEASVDQQQIDLIKIGNEIKVFDQDRKRAWVASIQRINPSVDPRTQMISIYLQVEGNSLREGMYLEGTIHSAKQASLSRIPKSALLRTGDVYVVNDTLIQQTPVEVMDIEDEHVWVSGLRNHDRIVENADLAYNGLILQ